MEDVDGKSSDQTINLKDLIAKAQNGVVADQLALGKHLIKNTDETDVAVGWLALAAEQCNEEAIEILTECLKCDKGINDKNREEIEWLVNSSPNEKSARRAAKKLYKTLIQSPGDDVDGNKSEISSKNVSKLWTLLLKFKRAIVWVWENGRISNIYAKFHFDVNQG